MQLELVLGQPVSMPIAQPSWSLTQLRLVTAMPVLPAGRPGVGVNPLIGGEVEEDGDGALSDAAVRGLKGTPPQADSRATIAGIQTSHKARRPMSEERAGLIHRYERGRSDGVLLGGG